MAGATQTTTLTISVPRADLTTQDYNNQATVTHHATEDSDIENFLDPAVRLLLAMMDDRND